VVLHHPLQTGQEGRLDIYALIDNDQLGDSLASEWPRIKAAFCQLAGRRRPPARQPG
jgi:hypothetical protein